MTYPQLQILNSKETAKILEMLKEQFGITEISGKIIQRGAERLFLYQGSFTKEKIKEIEQTIPIERIGVYFAKIVPGEEGIRLSIDGTHIFKNQITKNIFELTDKQAEVYLKGEELQLKTPEQEKGFKVIKYKNDFWGCGKASSEKISNFIPKQRRVKLGRNTIIIQKEED